MVIFIFGGNNNNGQFGMGDGQSGNARRGSPKNIGFTFVDWMTSHDNKDIAKITNLQEIWLHQKEKLTNVFNTYHQTIHLGG